MRIRRWIVPIAVALVATMVAIAAASAATPVARMPRHGEEVQDRARRTRSSATSGGIEMENLFKAACKMPPYKTQVDCSVYNSGNDVGKQTQQISNLISQGVDAIVINAASPTGLNGIIGQACARGILVVSFDNVVTAPCALKVNTDQFKFGQQLAQFLVDQLHGKGNVSWSRAWPARSVDDGPQQGRRVRVQEEPGHQGRRPLHRHVGLLHRAAQHGRAAAVAAEGRRHLGLRAARTASLKAFIAASKPLPLVGRRGRERLPQVPARRAATTASRSTGISIGQPPFLSVASLELAREILAEASTPRRASCSRSRSSPNKTVKSGTRRSSRTCLTVSSPTSPTRARRPPS